jgi:hypothetical protein
LVWDISERRRLASLEVNRGEPVCPQFEALLAPYPSHEMICWPVTPRVGNAKKNDPSLIEPIASD